MDLLPVRPDVGDLQIEQQRRAEKIGHRWGDQEVNDLPHLIDGKKR